MRTRLVNPTDFQILESLADERRNTAANLVATIDKDRNYLNTRLPVLADEGLIERVGSAEHSGLYQITPRGVAAAQNQAVYRSNREQFEQVVAEQELLITITEPVVHQTEVTASSNDQDTGDG